MHFRFKKSFCCPLPAERLIGLLFAFHKSPVIKQFVAARFPRCWNRLELDNLFTIRSFLHGQTRKNDKFVCQETRSWKTKCRSMDVRISYVSDQSINCASQYSSCCCSCCCCYWQWAIHSFSSCISNEFCRRLKSQAIHEGEGEEKAENEWSFVHQQFSWKWQRREEKDAACATLFADTIDDQRRKEENENKIGIWNPIVNRTRTNPIEKKREENGFRLDQLITEVDQHVQHVKRKRDVASCLFSLSFIRFRTAVQTEERRKIRRVTGRQTFIFNLNVKEKNSSSLFLSPECIDINVDVPQLNQRNNTNEFPSQVKKTNELNRRSSSSSSAAAVERSARRKSFRMNESSCSVQQMFSFNGHERTHSFVHSFDCVRCD